MTESKTYLLYARVSPKGSTWQGGETSIPVQLDECRNYVRSRDSGARFIEIFDELKSGRNLKRAGMQRVIAELKAGAKWDCLVVWSFDRVSRSLPDAVPLFQALIDHGKGVMCVRQNIDMFSAGGRFALNIFISAAQYEREMNSERTTAKMISIARKGKVPYGRIPLGFRREPGNHLVPVPEDLAIVTELFNVYASAGSMTDMLARYRNKLGSESRIYNMLRNPLYVGQIRYSGTTYPAEHKAVIPVELWNRVQSLLPGHVRGAARPSAQKYKYVMSGLVECHCGHKMTNYSVLKKGTRYHYYKCTDTACRNAVNAERLDNEVIDHIRAIVENGDYLTRAVHDYEAARREASAQLQPKLQAIAAATSKLDDEQSKIDHMFTSGVVTPANMAYWNDKLAALLIERKRLEEEQDHIKNEISANATSALPEILKAAGGWSALLKQGLTDYTIKRNLVLSLITKFRCTSKNAFEMKLVMTNTTKWHPIRQMVITAIIIIAR